jgi:AraC-like DNA-binding protein
MADTVAMNPAYFSRFFKRHTGENFADYLAFRLMEKAISLLWDPRYKVFEIAPMVGYFSKHNFYRRFRQHTGKTPIEYCNEVLRITYCRVVFKTAYRDGTVSVDVFDRSNSKTGSASLATAGLETAITIKPEQPSVHNKELAFALIQCTDSKGIRKPMEKRSITLSVSGGHLLAFGSACPYTLDDFHSGQATTYYGEALAIVRADSESGVTLTARMEKYQLLQPFQ